MKKKFKVIILITIGIIILVGVDGLSARYLKTRPLIAKKEKTYYEDVDYGKDNYNTGLLELGVVYKSLFADVYYCDTTVDTYDSEYHMEREQKIVRYYVKKGEKFTCQSSISYYPNDEGFKDYMNSDVQSDKEYIKAYAKDLYNDDSLRSLYDVNEKMGVMIYNFLGHYISEEYRDVFMFDIADFTKDPIKLEIDGFDLAWRGYQFTSSPSGNILAFYYSCGYKDQWAGSRKYTLEDCDKNKDSSGVYIFRVNGINDYEQLAFYPEGRNEYLSEYPDTYFVIDKVISDSEIVFKYTVSKNRQEEPFEIVKRKWNFSNDTVEEYQDE